MWVIYLFHMKVISADQWKFSQHAKSQRNSEARWWSWSSSFTNSFSSGSLKLPVFWPNAAEVWFAQADAEFAIRAVTVSNTKFYHAEANLPQDVAAQILNLIPASPAGHPYEVLKDWLRCILNLVDLTPRSSLPPRRSFPPSRRPELS